jgi:hypothetical protein
MSRRHRGLFLAAVLLAGCTAPAIDTSNSRGSVTPSLGTSTPASASASTASATQEFVAEADGFTLTVTVDRTTVEPGGDVTFNATFQNGTAEPTEYLVPWCGGAASITMSVALPLEPEGKTWDGIAQVFKNYALNEGLGPGGVPARAPVSVELRANPCVEGQFEATLEPGRSVPSTMVWPAEIVAGVPALAGKVSFKVSVGYDRQDVATSSSVLAGGQALINRSYKQLSLEGSVEVVGVGPRIVTAGEAVDALLEDQAFAAWLAAQPRPTWTNANLFLSSSPKAQGIVPAGPSWEIELFPESNAPRHWAIAFVDPFDASVRSVTYCNVPCDR